MVRVTISLEPSVALFYSRIANSAGYSLEQILADALFKLAGELSLEAIAADYAVRIVLLIIPKRKESEAVKSYQRA